MNLAFTPVTRRAIPVDYISPGILFLIASSQSGSGSGVEAVATFQANGPVVTISNPTSHTLRLSWALLTDAAMYVVYRATAPAGPFVRYLSGVVSDHYVDTPSIPGTYYYYVTAIEPNAGETKHSNTVSGATV